MNQFRRRRTADAVRHREQVCHPLRQPFVEADLVSKSTRPQGLYSRHQMVHIRVSASFRSQCLNQVEQPVDHQDRGHDPWQAGPAERAHSKPKQRECRSDPKCKHAPRPAMSGKPQKEDQQAERGSS